MAEEQKYIKKRSSLKAKITSFSNYIEVLNSCSELSMLQRLELETRFNKFDALYVDFDALQTDIESLTDQPDAAYAARAQFEDSYFPLVAQARKLLTGGEGEKFGGDCAGSVTDSTILNQDYGVASLKLLELRVPAHVALGSRAQMSCRWELGPADVLYSVKWYKDGKEFFRHVPRDSEPRRKFPLPGVDVEKSSPNGANVTLYPAVLETGGRYRCEVSGERPLFPTVSEHSDMVIVALPDHGPTITGSRLRYQIGDRVQVNCTSGRSRPATRLAWYINGEPAPSATLRPQTYEEHEDGLQTTSLSLDFKVKQKHFRKGDLKLKCLATIATVYWRSNEESVQGEKLKGYSRSRELTEGSRADRVHAAGKPNAAVGLTLALYLFLTCIMLHTSQDTTFS